MSDYHARQGLEDGNEYVIVMHIPIPDVNNRVGVNYRTALVGSGIGGTSVMAEGVGAGEISTAELTQIQNGEVYEHVVSITTFPGETSTQYRNRIDAIYSSLVTEIQSELQNILNYWGFSRDVP